MLMESKNSDFIIYREAALKIKYEKYENIF
jgi:hypothetical protein